MTGFDNKDQLDALASQLRTAIQSVEQVKAESQKCSDALKQIDDQLKMIEALIQVDFSTINLPGAEADLSRSRDRLGELLDPNSDASQAKSQYDSESAQLKTMVDKIGKMEREIAIRTREQEEAKVEIRKAETRVGRGLSEAEATLAEKDLAVAPDIPAKDLGDVERDVEHSIDSKLNELREKVAELERTLVRLMGVARVADTGALVNIGSDIDDVPHYLDRLRVLNEEALPESAAGFWSTLLARRIKG